MGQVNLLLVLFSLLLISFTAGTLVHSPAIKGPGMSEPHTGGFDATCGDTVVEAVVYFDFEYVWRHHPNHEERAEEIMSFVNNTYCKNLGWNVNLLSKDISIFDVSSSDCFGALSELQEFADIGREPISILFTGKVFTWSVLGCAVQDGYSKDRALVAVTVPPFSSSQVGGFTSWERTYYSSILVSHELGHTFNATHSEALPGHCPVQSPCPAQTLMYPDIIGNLPTFSEANANRMESVNHGE